MSNNDKDKKTAQTAETESFEGYEDEAMENAEEGSEIERVSSPERSLSTDICSASRSPSVTEETNAEDEEALISLSSYEERKRRILEEKWRTVTGKKPRNIPTVMKYFDEINEKFIFFGDRRQAEVEKHRRERLLKAARKVPRFEYNQGKVKVEIFNESLFSGLLCIKFEPGGKNMATSNRRGGIQLLETATGNTFARIKTIESGDRLPIKGLCYHPIYVEKLYAGGEAGKIQVYDGLSGALLGVSEPLTAINVMDISSDGSFLVTGGKEGRINVIDPATFQVISSKRWPELHAAAPPGLNEQFHRLRIYGLKFHPTRTNFFVTGGFDGTVKVWDVRTQAAVRSITGPKICGRGVDVNENEIITASWQAEGSLNLWSFSQARLIKNIPIKNKSTEYEGEFLYAAQLFSDDPAFPTVNGRLVAFGGSGFFNLVVLNMDTEQIVANFPSFKPILDMDIYGNLIAYGGKESLFRVGEMEDVNNLRKRRY